MLQQMIRPVAAVLTVAGLAAAVYYAFDIRYPSHFVGDMYGMEVMARSCLLATTCLALFGSLLMFLIGWKKDMPKLATAGLLLTDLCAALLMVLAGHVYRSRSIDAVRKSYQYKSTTELIRIATEERDQFALYQILSRRDSSAIPALIALLLDPDQDAVIRLESAHTLGQLGGAEARAALEQAAKMSEGDRYFTDTIRYSLENIEMLEQKKEELYID